ncbi:MAG: exosortase/archaeosortase family protein [Phycisphaera sp.]|nr:MAG: exosortase/archaeosortase family protein [Phycisphaera sp.]
MSVASASQSMAHGNAASDAVGSLRWQGVALLGVVALAAFAWLFREWFVVQSVISSKNLDDWGHAFAVPLIAGYLLYQRRERLLNAQIKPFWPGLLPLLLGIACYVFFIVGVPTHMLQGFALVLAVFGFVLLVFGPQVIRVAIMPIAFLLFAVTISERVMIAITFQLQLIASQGGYVLLTIFGYPFGVESMVEGNIISVMDDAGNTNQLNVAEACSGMRMVVAFIALGAAVALTQCRHWWQRVAVLLLSLPVAIGLNVVRVAVLGFLTALVDPDLASGEAHMLIGTLLLVPGLAIFLLLVWILNRVVSDEPTKDTAKAVSA